MINLLAFVALHALIVFVAGFLTEKTVPRASFSHKAKVFIGILLSTLFPLGFLQWWVLRNRSPAYAESCMLQALAGIGYLVVSSYGLGWI